MIIDRIDHAHLYYTVHPKFKGAFDVVAFAAGHVASEFVLPHKLLHVPLGQLGLRIECIEMARAAFHEEADAGFGFCGVMLRFRRERSDLVGCFYLVRAQQRMKRG